MRRLIFIDDDRTELDDFLRIVEGECHCTPVHWPHESAKLLDSPSPDIFVSDLYLPSGTGDSKPTAAQEEEAQMASKQVGERLFGLYADSSLDDKLRLKETMKAIVDAQRVLRFQWSALGQSPTHGIELLKQLKARYPDVTFVFYSRKITPEDVIHVLQAGATDALRKGALKDEEVLNRLAAAQEIHHGADVKSIKASGFNINVTVIPGE